MTKTFHKHVKDDREQIHSICCEYGIPFYEKGYLHFKDVLKYRCWEVKDPQTTLKKLVEKNPYPSNNEPNDLPLLEAFKHEAPQFSESLLIQLSSPESPALLRNVAHCIALLIVKTITSIKEDTDVFNQGIGTKTTTDLEELNKTFETLSGERGLATLSSGIAFTLLFPFFISQTIETTDLVSSSLWNSSTVSFVMLQMVFQNFSFDAGHLHTFFLIIKLARVYNPFTVTKLILKIENENDISFCFSETLSINSLEKNLFFTLAKNSIAQIRLHSFKGFQEKPVDYVNDIDLIDKIINDRVLIKKILGLSSKAENPSDQAYEEARISEIIENLKENETS